MTFNFTKLSIWWLLTHLNFLQDDFKPSCTVYCMTLTLYWMTFNLAEPSTGWMLCNLAEPSTGRLLTLYWMAFNIIDWMNFNLGKLSTGWLLTCVAELANTTPVPTNCWGNYYYTIKGFMRYYKIGQWMESHYRT